MIRFRGRDLFQKNKRKMLFLSKCCEKLPESIRIRMFLLLKYKNGKMGIACRYILLKSIAKKCGDNVSIHQGVYLLNPQKLVIGNNVSIHPMCYIDASGIINIGNDVSIAHGTTIMSTNHTYSNVSINIKEQSLQYKKTIIENNVWIGAKCTILSGVTIRDGNVIGAGTIVTKCTDSNGVYVGIPAKKIKNREIVL
ncbi:MAG: acyltransferase [Eubacterium sp.]